MVNYKWAKKDNARLRAFVHKYAEKHLAIRFSFIHDDDSLSRALDSIERSEGKECITRLYNAWRKQESEMRRSDTKRRTFTLKNSAISALDNFAKLQKMNKNEVINRLLLDVDELVRNLQDELIQQKKRLKLRSFSIKDQKKSYLVAKKNEDLLVSVIFDAACFRIISEELELTDDQRTQINIEAEKLFKALDIIPTIENA